SSVSRRILASNYLLTQPTRSDFPGCWTAGRNMTEESLRCAAPTARRGYPAAGFAAPRYFHALIASLTMAQSPRPADRVPGAVDAPVLSDTSCPRLRRKPPPSRPALCRRDAAPLAGRGAGELSPPAGVRGAARRR